MDKRAKKDDILEALQCLGTISQLKLPFSVKKGKNLGYGYVDFEST